MDEFPWLPIILLICAAFLTYSISKWVVAYVAFLWATKLPKRLKKHRKHKKYESESSSSSEDSSSE